MPENEENTFRDGEYDSPIILPGPSDIEPERYVAVKPYDLTRFEYSFLTRNFTGDFWCNIVAGATGGILITVIAKAVTALLDKKSPELETWEIVAIGIGVIVYVCFKFFLKSEDDKKKSELVEVIDKHFQTSKPRRVHLTRQEDRDET